MASASGNKLTYGIYAYIAYSVSSTATTTTLSVTKAVARTDKSSIGATKIGGSITGTGQTKKSTSGKTMKSSADVTIFSPFTWSWARGTSTASKSISFKVTYAGGTSTASFSVSVPALASYAVSYNANGGSGAPGGQTKYYGIALALSGTRPIRTGYTFVNWKASNGTTYAPGASYTANAATTLTAQWKANTSTISYNANGGAGSVASQTKTYGQTLTLSNGATLSKTNHSITGWNTAADGTGTAYSLSQVLSTTFISNLTLYAQWHLDYMKPVISNLDCFRVANASSTQEIENGQYIRISFDYQGGTLDAGESYIAPTCVITIDGTQVYSGTLSASGSFSANYGTYSIDSRHTVVVKLYDSNDTSGVTADGEVATAIYPIDLYGETVNDETHVYMGLMHTYVPGQEVTVPDLYVDGDAYIYVDDTAGSGTTDYEIITALGTLGWATDCLIDI